MSYSADGLSGGYYNNEELVALQQLVQTQRSIIAVQGDKIRSLESMNNIYKDAIAKAEHSKVLSSKNSK